MIVKRILKESERFKELVLHGQPFKPLSIKIKITNNCNLKCKMCSHWRRFHENLPYEIMATAVRDVIDMGCKKIHFTGGEPLLYPKFYELIDYIMQCDQGVEISMTSNGTLIDEKSAKRLVDCGLRKANISIDSPNETVNDSIRGVNGAFARACNGLRMLRKHMPTCPIFINTVVSPWNYKTLKDYPKLAKDLGANGIHFLMLDVHTAEVSPFNPAQIKEYYDITVPAVLAEAEKYDITIQRSQLPVLDRMDTYANYYLSHRCYAIFSHLLINYLGKVYPCCNLMNNPMGDLHHNSIKEIWYGESYQEIRKQKILPIDLKCLDCNMFLEENLLIEELCFLGKNYHE